MLVPSALAPCSKLMMYVIHKRSHMARSNDCSKSEVHLLQPPKNTHMHTVCVTHTHTHMSYTHAHMSHTHITHNHTHTYTHTHVTHTHAPHHSCNTPTKSAFTPSRRTGAGAWSFLGKKIHHAQSLGSHLQWRRHACTLWFKVYGNHCSDSNVI